LIGFQVIMAVELVLVFYEQQWMHAFLIIAIMAVTFVPAALGRQFRVYIPSEFQLLAVGFVFAALFLGEIQSYYERIWWWDIALHASSGLLMGILGFLLVYVLNESERIDVNMRPHFVALFAFLFAVAVGSLWEIFEFTMDQVIGTNMQKPMFGDPSGLSDTIWDLIVNMLGALAISALGWRYMRRREASFIEAWIRKFIERNPRLFRT
jgi:glycopeptide antibiotics resistance protein